MGMAARIHGEPPYRTEPGVRACCFLERLPSEGVGRGEDQAGGEGKTEGR